MSLLVRLLLSSALVAILVGVLGTHFKMPLLDVGDEWTINVYKYYELILDRTTSYLDVFTTVVYTAVTVVAIYIGYLFYGLIFRPIDRVKLLGEGGYQPDGTMSMKEISKYVKKRRKLGDIPPVYPNGWFALTESWKLVKDTPLNLHVLGQQLAVFRDEKGTAHALDAYCPHMGANLAVGGRVIGDCIECPFHGWKFRGHDGKCTDIPYAEKIPEIARVKSWPLIELNGWLYIWYHAEGAEPNWTPPEIPEITDGTWKYAGRLEHHINCHLEEIPENGADLTHLTYIHGPVIAAGNTLTSMRNRMLSFARHVYKATWSPNPAPESHISTTDLTHELKVFDFSINLMFIKIQIRQIGPGIVYFTFENMFGKGVFEHHVIPVEPLVQKLVHNIYVHWTIPNVFAKFLLFGHSIQVERDIHIWNNKCYEREPLLVKSSEDSLLGRHRRWFSQFYSENSPRLRCRKDTLDW